MRAARAATLAVLAGLASVALAGCCCFGGFDEYMPPERDDQGAMDEARRYYQAHADELVERVMRGRDGGVPGSGGGCTSGLGALALDVAVAVASRGHAGGSSAAEVSIDPGACFDRVVVLLVLANGVWRVVRATGYLGYESGVVIGDDVMPYRMQESVDTSGDVDWGSDELF